MTRLIPLIALLLLCAKPSHAAAPIQAAERSGYPGDALRSRLGAVVPTANTMVIIYGIAQHHTRTEWSIVASRTKEGRWIVTRAGEEGPGLLGIAPHPLPSTEKTLSSESAAALDRLLHERKTLREKVRRDGDMPIGGFASQMEIITPDQTRKVEWVGRLSGKLGRIVDLVTSAG